MKPQVLLWSFSPKTKFYIGNAENQGPRLTRLHFNRSLSSHSNLLAKNLNVKDILHGFILSFSLLSTGAYCTSTAVESKSTGSTEFLDEELGEGDVLICAQGLVAMLPVQHQIILIVCICEKAETEVTKLLKQISSSFLS